MIWIDISDPLVEKSKTARRHLSAKLHPAIFSSDKIFGISARLVLYFFNTKFVLKYAQCSCGKIDVSYILKYWCMCILSGLSNILFLAFARIKYINLIWSWFFLFTALLLKIILFIRFIALFWLMFMLDHQLQSMRFCSSGTKMTGLNGSYKWLEWRRNKLRYVWRLIFITFEQIFVLQICLILCQCLIF